MGETIRYNVAERGRTHRGQDRNFDLGKLAAVVNGPETQERVRNRDMLGYYGHWVRAKFGIIPPEQATIGGKIVSIEPAIVTTRLTADSNGNIEHETEFLDTAAGKIAKRLHGSRTGGFSSAIHARPKGGLDVPTIFAGFDYVLEPNYTTNRGYMFDSVDGIEDGMIFDFVMQDVQRTNSAMATLYDSLQGDHMLALEVIERLREENEEMLSMIARGAGGNVVMDSAGGARPLLLPTTGARTFADRARGFRDADLAPLGKLPKESEQAAEGDMILDRVHQHYGVRR